MLPITERRSCRAISETDAQERRARPRLVRAVTGVPGDGIWRFRTRANDRIVCRAPAVRRDRGDVPFDVDAVPDAAHERGEPSVVCVNREPACGPIAVGSERVGDERRHGNESTGSQRDRLGLLPDLEGQFAFEDIEGIGVLMVHVWAGYLLTCGAPGVDDRDILARDEDADLVPGSSNHHLAIGDRPDHGAGVRPWRRITVAIAAKSGGPPAAESSTAATSRK